MRKTADRIGLLVALSLAACASQRPAPADGGRMPDAAASLRVPEDHRPAEVACDSPRASEVPDGGWGADAGSCSSDEDCADGGRNGRCVVSSNSGSTLCTFDDCVVDSDCGDAGVCVCRSGQGYDTNTCVPAGCHIDADCGVGGDCSPVVLGCAGLTGVAGYYCHTATDQCVNDSDCVDTAVQDLHCVFDIGAARWVCGPVNCSG